MAKSAAATPKDSNYRLRRHIVLKGQKIYRTVPANRMKELEPAVAVDASTRILPKKVVLSILKREIKNL
jgi:hypothetical protein